MLGTQASLYDLGIFNQVDTAVQNPTGEDPSKNVLIDVREAKRYTFNYGLGLEVQTGQPSRPARRSAGQNGISPRVSLEVTRLNFRGLDHTITFKGHLGRLQQRALISYNAPGWLDNDKLTLSFTGFYDNTLDITTFTSKRLEGSAQLHQCFGTNEQCIVSGRPPSEVVYSFTYRRVQASNLVISPNLIPILSQPTRVGIPASPTFAIAVTAPWSPPRALTPPLDAGCGRELLRIRGGFQPHLGAEFQLLPLREESSPDEAVRFCALDSRRHRRIPSATPRFWSPTKS